LTTSTSVIAQGGINPLRPVPTVARLDEVKNGDASATIKVVGAIDIANVSLADSEKRNKRELPHLSNWDPVNSSYQAKLQFYFLFRLH
jgi:hypothetical protein